MNSKTITIPYYGKNAGVEYVTLTTDQVISGSKFFTSIPLTNVTPTELDHITNKKYVDEKIVANIQAVIATLADYVPLNEDANVGGLKVFSQLPEVPKDLIPDVLKDEQLVTKKYVDDTITDGFNAANYVTLDTEQILTADAKKTFEGEVVINHQPTADNNPTTKIYVDTMVDAKVKEELAKIGNVVNYKGVTNPDDLAALVDMAIGDLYWVLTQDGGEWKIYNGTEWQIISSSALDAGLVLRPDEVATITATYTFTMAPQLIGVPQNPTDITNKKYVDDTAAKYVPLQGAAQIDDLKTFTTLPQSNVLPTAEEDLVNKRYVDAQINNGGYTLPVATDVVLGGVKIGQGLQITADGELSTTHLGAVDEAAIKSITGDLADLATTDKTNLVAAINEIFNKPGITLTNPVVYKGIITKIDLDALQNAESGWLYFVENDGFYIYDGNAWNKVSDKTVVDTSNLLTTNTAQNITATKVFKTAPQSEMLPQGDADIANKKYVDEENAKNVTLATDQTITGVKTFVGIPKLQGTPVADNDLVNKAYVDTIANNGGGGAAPVNAVTLDTIQTITAQKTFTAGALLTNTPAVDTDAVNKKYVDDAIANIGGGAQGAADLTSVATDILPDQTDLRNIGSNDKQWNKLHVNDIEVDSLVLPKTTDVVSLGSADQKFKNAYFTGSVEASDFKVGVTPSSTPADYEIKVTCDAFTTGVTLFSFGQIQLTTDTGETLNLKKYINENATTSTPKMYGILTKAVVASNKITTFTNKNEWDTYSLLDGEIKCEVSMASRYINQNYYLPHFFFPSWQNSISYNIGIQNSGGSITLKLYQAKLKSVTLSTATQDAYKVRSGSYTIKDLSLSRTIVDRQYTVTPVNGQAQEVIPLINLTDMQVDTSVTKTLGELINRKATYASLGNVVVGNGLNVDSTGLLSCDAANVTGLVVLTADTEWTVGVNGKYKDLQSAVTAAGLLVSDGTHKLTIKVEEPLAIDTTIDINGKDLAFVTIDFNSLQHTFNAFIMLNQSRLTIANLTCTATKPILKVHNGSSVEYIGSLIIESSASSPVEVSGSSFLKLSTEEAELRMKALSTISRFIDSVENSYILINCKTVKLEGPTNYAGFYVTNQSRLSLVLADITAPITVNNVFHSVGGSSITLWGGSVTIASAATLNTFFCNKATIYLNNPTLKNTKSNIAHNIFTQYGYIIQ